MEENIKPLKIKVPAESLKEILVLCIYISNSHTWYSSIINIILKYNNVPLFALDSFEENANSNEFIKSKNNPNKFTA